MPRLLSKMHRRGGFKLQFLRYQQVVLQVLLEGVHRLRRQTVRIRGFLRQLPLFLPGL